jgi:26S proteasome regulatory subunit N3
MSNNKPPTNGTDPVENGVNGTEDIEMEEDSSKPSGRTKPGKDKDGDEEMTVVVPPPKASKLSGAPQKDDEGDIAMNGVAEADTKEPVEQVDDPKNKAVAGMSG